MCVLVLIMVALASSAAGVHAEQTISDGSGKVSSDHCFCLETVVSGIQVPVSSIFFMDAGVERVLVLEQVGLAKVYSKKGDFIRVFLDIRDHVAVSADVGDSRGLLSMALDPMYDQNKRVFVYYIRNVSNEDFAYLSSFTTSGGVVDLSTERTLFRLRQPFKTGNGGPMLFGDDGYLYLATGDGGEEDDKSGNAQNLNTLFGKILRLDVHGGVQSLTQGDINFGKLYNVPVDNPFLNDQQAMDEVYAYGVRNMWGCSQDIEALGGDGRIFCAETGTNKSDEIDVLEKGKNYGWNLKEGSHCLPTANCSNIVNEATPIYEFTHTASHALVGGHVNRGSDFQGFNTSYAIYTFGDVVTGKMYVLEENSTNSWNSLEWPHCDTASCPSNAKTAPLAHITNIGRDMKGELYLGMSEGLSITSDKGGLYKMVPSERSSAQNILPSFNLMAGALLMALWTKGVGV